MALVQETSKWCSALQALELAAESVAANHSDVVRYETALSSWRATEQLDPPPCRLEAIGRHDLCKRGKEVAALSQGNSSASPIWIGLFAELQRHLDQDCERFHEYDNARWRPPLFKMCDATTPAEWWRRIHRLPDFQSYWARTATQVNYFGSRVGVAEMDGLRLRWERVQHVHHLVSLKAASGVRPDELGHVLEFGAGTGDNVPLLRELGFTGSHLIFDVPPMLLLQRFVLRYSGWPAYLGARISGDRSVVLESDAAATAQRVVRSFGLSSLFLATFSLTEAPLEARAWLEPTLRRFGFVLIAFRPYWDGFDNIAYLRRLLRTGLSRHSACAWRMPERDGLDPGSKPSYYFVAVHRDVGRARCEPEVGCTPAAHVPLLGDCGGAFPAGPPVTCRQWRVSCLEAGLLLQDGLIVHYE